MPEWPASDGRHRRDSGVTLVEMLVVMVIFSLLLGVVWSVLITVQLQTKDTIARSDATDQARLALQQIDRQVRSGNVLYDPAAETLNMSMRVYTQANGQQRCVQWQVVAASGELRMRSWQSETPDLSSSGWSVIARNLVNKTTSSPPTPPFALQGATTPYGSRLIDIRLLVRTPGTSGPPVEVQSSLSGRNTQYGYDPGVCNIIPSS